MIEVINVSITSTTTSFVCILLLAWVWSAVDWVWFRPRRVERRLRNAGFKGDSYRFWFGEKKQAVEVIEEVNSNPADSFSNDYGPQANPLLLRAITTYGPRVGVIITKPEEIRELMMKHNDFHKQKGNPLLNKLSNGLLRLENPKWAQRRKFLNPAFHTDKLKYMLAAFTESGEAMINKWEKITSKTGSCEIEMWSFLHDMSADAISQAAFGSSFQQGTRIFQLIREQLYIVVRSFGSVYIPGSRFLPTPTNRKVEKISKEIEALLKDLIYKRKKEMEDGEVSKDDLLGLLLRSCFEDETGSTKGFIKLSFKDVVQECKQFYLAGQETTSSLLVWTLILLSKHQDWQEQAREEIRNTFGNDKPNYDDLVKLKKVNMILHEVLRLYPPILQIIRDVSHDTTLGDTQLPAGAVINVPLIYFHHNEKIWGADAKEFRPDRFSDGIINATGGNMSFLSFGWGPRICIGSNFAMMEVKVTLALILQRFSLQLSPSYTHVPTAAQGTLRPQFGAHIIIHPL